MNYCYSLMNFRGIYDKNDVFALNNLSNDITFTDRLFDVSYKSCSE